MQTAEEETKLLLFADDIKECAENLKYIQIKHYNFLKIIKVAEFEKITIK